MILRNYAIYGEAAREADPGFAHVEKVSDRAGLHKGVVEAHNHPYLHQLSLWRNGEGTYHLEGNSHQLEGTILTWVPSSTLHGFTISGACDAWVVSVSDDYLQSELAGIPWMADGMNWREPAVLSVPDVLAERLAATFQDVAEEYATLGALRQQALSARIQLVFIEFARLTETQHQSSCGQGTAWRLYQRFRAALDRHLENGQGGMPMVARLAQQLGTTPYLLNKAVRSTAGIGPSALIRRLFIQKAQRLLLFTELKVAAVGYALGIDDPAHFGRLFRGETGTTPKIWRERERPAMSAGRTSETREPEGKS